MIEQPARKRTGFFARLWRVFTTPSAHFSLGAILGYGFFAGIVFWGGFHWAMKLSDTETFCLSCHEMREFVYPDVVASQHYGNQSGVRAICSDCHVPQEWAHMMARKAYATVNELYHHAAGSISTREKYEARRLIMAEKVWTRMVASDSRECRNCHDYDYMDLARQEGLAARQHQLAIERGVTCIDCHKGIAHSLPEGAPQRRLLVDLR